MIVAGHAGKLKRIEELFDKLCDGSPCCMPMAGFTVLDFGLGVEDDQGLDSVIMNAVGAYCQIRFFMCGNEAPEPPSGGGRRATSHLVVETQRVT
ncbi:hypothetical protein R1flu_024107 [Riccia fluitans]|uniref:Uncharacterized protein n=1 Tax=Riccia fluitans TaxID=41844 RepID=A0ABD1XUD6_9MARC